MVRWLLAAAGDRSGCCGPWTKACYGFKRQEDPTWALIASSLPGVKCGHYCLGTIPGQLGGQRSWFRTLHKVGQGV